MLLLTKPFILEYFIMNPPILSFVSLAGQKGDVGFQGQVGSPGDRGSQGQAGLPGPVGIGGSRGVRGPPGRPGSAGDPGDFGLPVSSGSHKWSNEGGCRGDGVVAVEMGWLSWRWVGRHGDGMVVMTMMIVRNSTNVPALGTSVPSVVHTDKVTSTALLSAGICW